MLPLIESISLWMVCCCNHMVNVKLLCQVSVQAIDKFSPHICKTTLPHQKCWLTKFNNLALKQPCLLRYPESSSQARCGNCISRKFSESVVGVLRDHLLS